MRSINKRWSVWMIAFGALVFVVLTLQYRIIGPDGQGWRTSINSDGEGYYAYLTGIFVQGGLAKADAAEYHFTQAGDGRVIQYYLGTPLLQLPFFLVAHAWVSATGGSPDNAMGFGYQLAIIAASGFYLIFGLYHIRELLLGMRMTDGAVAFSLAVLLFGSGLLYHSVITPAMSHVYGFAMVAWVLAMAQRAWSDGARWLAWLAVALALAMLVRPTLVLVLLCLPLVAIQDPQPFIFWLRKILVRTWIVSVGIGALLLFLQPLAWFVQSGEWWADPYAGEGFNWKQPHVWSVLFGARKGFFFYWPLLLLMLPGLYLIIRRSPLYGTIALIGLMLITYVTSAWWSWYYGHGYGLRAMLDILPVLAMPIGHVYLEAHKRVRRAIWIGAVPLMALQMFQSWQYHTGIIHPFNMDREKYGLVFLQTSNDVRGAFGWSHMAPPYAPHGMEVLVEGFFEADTEDGSIKLDEHQRRSPLVRIAPAELPVGSTFFIHLSCRRKAMERGASNSVQIVTTLRRDGHERVVMRYPLNDINILDDRAWRHWRHAFIVPQAVEGEEMLIELQQEGGGRVVVKDLLLRVEALRLARDQ